MRTARPPGGACHGSRIGALFAALLAFSASSCSTGQHTKAAVPGRIDYVRSIDQLFGASHKPKLQFLGDSITYLARADINSHYDGRYNVAIDALVGADTYEYRHNVASAARADPRDVIINLGTNDAVRIGHPWSVEPHGLTLAQVSENLSTFRSEFPASTCVIFVTIDTHDAAWDPVAAGKINAYIRSKFAHVVDWDGAWSPRYFDQPDDPHPNAAGRRALLSLEDQALAGC